MTLEEIEEFEDAKGKVVQLFGYTSTSLDQNLALSFAWDDQRSGHQKVLFQINWDDWN